MCVRERERERWMKKQQEGGAGGEGRRKMVVVQKWKLAKQKRDTVWERLIYEKDGRREKKKQEVEREEKDKWSLGNRN